MVFIVFIGNVKGATIAATTCNQTDVQTAINSASNGDTVTVPAGNCTWTQDVSNCPDSNNLAILCITKGINLFGAGIGNTTIINNVTTAGESLIRYNPSDYSANLPFRINGFTFEANGNRILALGIQNKAAPFTIQRSVRVDHNNFTNNGQDRNGQAILNYGGMYGIVDNNFFDGLNYPMKEDPQTGNDSWWASAPQNIFSYGSSYYLYYEDNSFVNMGGYAGGGDNVIHDAQNGARYVYRYNQIQTLVPSYSLFENHGEQAGMASNFGNELYGNEVISTNNNQIDFFKQRSGQALVFENNINTTGSSSIIAYNTGGGLTLCPTNYTSLKVTHNSYWWGNRKSVNGGLLTATAEGGLGNATDPCNGLIDIPTLGRDVFSDTSSPNISYGTLANLPSTCITNQGYWATNQNTSNLAGRVGVNPSTSISGTFYKCTSTNTWTEYYVPYYYPHPLVSGIPGVDMDAPNYGNETNNATVLFTLSAIESTNLSNMTLYGNWTGAWQANQTANLTGTYNTTNFTKTLSDGRYLWGAYVCDNENNCRFGTRNYTLTVDATAPNVSAFYNSVNNGNYSGTIVLNASVSDALIGMSSVYFNITYTNGTQINFTQADASGSYYNLSLDTSGFTDGNYNVTVYANDTLTNLNNTERIKITIDNTNPTATLSCSPTTVSTGEIITCTCAGSDGTGSGIQTTSHTASPSTSAAGTYSTSCTVTDYVSKTGTASLSYTVNSVGGGSGLGSGSTATGHSWDIITPENPGIFKDFNKKIGINEIRIEVKEDATDVKVSVTQYNEKPEEVPSSSGDIYKYIKIETKNLEDKLAKAKVKIQVEKSWLSENNLKKENVAVFQLDETSNEWGELITSYTNEDENYSYYEIEIDSFSYFIIAEKVLEQQEEVEITEAEKGFNIAGIWNKIKEFAIGLYENTKAYHFYILIGAGIIVIVGIVFTIRHLANSSLQVRSGKRMKYP